MKTHRSKSRKATVLFSVAVLLAGGAAAATPGEKVAFASNRDGNNEIYVMNPDGSEQTRLTNDPGSDFHPSFSGDGTRITFSSTRDGNGEVYVMNSDGTNQTRLTTAAASDTEPSFSADGTRITFRSQRDGNDEVYVMEADGSNQTRLTTNTFSDTEPLFSPDGTRIAFSSVGPTNNLDVWLMNADGSNQTRLTIDPLADFNPSFSPDGTRIAFSSFRDNNFEIYVMNADGANQTRVTNTGVSDRDPCFSPDNTRIMFQSNVGPNDEIFVINVDGTNQTRLTEIAGNDLAPDWTDSTVAPPPTPTPSATATATPGGTATFSNPAPITIPDAGVASPYPSTVTATGVGTIPAAPGSVQVTITGFSHPFPDDVGIVLVGPTGAALLLQDGAGDDPDVAGVTYTLSDAGTAQLPDLTAWGTGTYKPTAYYTGRGFPVPGPGTNYGNPGPAGGGAATFASVFGGTNADGVWSLHVVDFGPIAGFGDGAAAGISGGWSLSIGTGPAPGQLLNIATRMRVQTGENVMIGGFIITGSDPKNLIIRGIGPSLAQFFPGAIANPTLDLFQGSTLLASNDDWRDSQQAEIEATGIPPSHDFESAIVRTMAPGSYTAVLRGKNDTTGIGVVEAYDLNAAASSQLANIATRGFVETGDNAMIGGFILGGAVGASSRVVVRAIGPSLTAFGVAGALPDPALELKDANGLTVMSNDDWQQSQAAEITATGLAPTDSHESALVTSLPNGSYTAIVRGAGDTTGVGLVEVYKID